MKKIFIVLSMFVLISCTTKKEAQTEMRMLFPNAEILPISVERDAHYYLINDTVGKRYVLVKHYDVGGMVYAPLPITYCEK